ncbi:retrovirus-related Pol polyprotein from transposon 412 [Trichonephila clavipes]|nr:retrovirus-related Pol polyprotein from transposon 412 [Trichonephila clavipes]
MVKKKDGSSRMCIDYRKLNQKLVKDKFTLPIIEDVLDTLQEAKVYSTLDLRNGFFHVDVDEDCRKYTSFIVPDGQFEFNKVPFGLSTSPGVFQRYVSSHIVESGTIKPSPTKTLAVQKFPEPTTIKQVQSFLGLTGYFRKKKASLYKENDLVAIQRTQFGAGLKLRPKFLSPYKVTKVNSKDRYEVEKVGQHDGPNSTTTSADLMKHFYA